MPLKAGFYPAGPSAPRRKPVKRVLHRFAFNRQGSCTHRRNPRRGSGHLGSITNQVPGGHGDPAGLHVYLEHARRADPDPGIGPVAVPSVGHPPETCHEVIQPCVIPFG